MKKNKIKTFFKYTLIFFIFFILLSGFKNYTYFTDEGDNFLAGTLINRGVKIYSGFYSQHLPGMYYICALLNKLGMHTIEQYRLGCYAILSLIWLFTIIHYSKEFKFKNLIIFPLVYISFMSFGNLSGTMVADQFQAQLLYILMLELIQFIKKEELSKYSIPIISLTIFMSVMIAFVSIIPIFIFVIGMFIIDIKKYKKENNQFNFIKYFNYFFKKYYLLIICCIIPFIIFIVHLVVTNTLQGCYDQAFYLNTTIYPKYNGYGSNFIITIINTIIGYPQYLYSLFSSVLNNNNQLPSLITLIINILMIIGLAKFIIKDKKYNYLIVLIYVFSCGNRSLSDFHGLPYQAVIIFLAIYSYNDGIINFKFKNELGLILLAVTTIPYSTYMPQITQGINNHKEENILIKDFIGNGKILSFDLNTALYVNSDIMPASRMYSLVPWFAEVYEDTLLNDIKKNDTKLLIYSPEIDIWGYKIKDYAKKLNKYIMDNYKYSNETNLWVNNKYIDSFEEKFNVNVSDNTNSQYNHSKIIPIREGMDVNQEITSVEMFNRVDIDITTYERTNYNNLKIKIYSNNELIKQLSINASELNEGYLPILLNSEYNNITVTISSQNDNESNYVGVYVTDYEIFEDDKLIINESEVQGSLKIREYYN